MPTGYQLRKEFQEYISRALSPTYDTENRSLISFVKSEIYRQNASWISPETVISEATLEALKSIQSRIDNPNKKFQTVVSVKGWYRIICRNVIAAMIGANIRQEKIAHKTAANTDSLTLLKPESVLSERVVTALLEAIASLTPMERSIFLWRVEEELSWQNVSERVNAHFGEKTNAVNIRKRGSRIRETLQSAFLSNESLDEDDKEQVCALIQRSSQELWQ